MNLPFVHLLKKHKADTCYDLSQSFFAPNQFFPYFGRQI